MSSADWEFDMDMCLQTIQTAQLYLSRISFSLYSGDDDDQVDMLRERIRFLRCSVQHFVEKLNEADESLSN